MISLLVNMVLCCLIEPDSSVYNLLTLCLWRLWMRHSLSWNIIRACYCRASRHGQNASTGSTLSAICHISNSCSISWRCSSNIKKSKSNLERGRIARMLYRNSAGATLSLCITMHCPIPPHPQKIASYLGASRPHLIHGSMDSSNPPPQMASQSNQLFFHNAHLLLVDRLTDILINQRNTHGTGRVRIGHLR